MRILYIALSCGPNLGSEDAVGWNVPMDMAARGHEVYVLTRSDKREEIEAYRAVHPNLAYPEFRYQPLSKVAEACKGPLYSLRAKMWCSDASATVCALCKDLHPDVVHQLTPVEFRAPVDLTDINAFKVLGPVGGAGDMPNAFDRYLRFADRCIEGLRAHLNSRAVREPATKRAYAAFDVVMAANEETRVAVSPLCSHDVVLHSEVAVKRLFPVMEPVQRAGNELVIGFAGRLHYRKGVAFLLDCVQRMSTPFRLLIAGDGPERERIETLVRERGLTDKVDLLGRVPYDKMAEFYRRIDVLAFPSFREATGSVIIEALAAGVPVVSLGIFGASVVLADNPGFLVGCEGSLEDIAERFAATLDAVARGERIFDWSGRDCLSVCSLATFFENSYREGVRL